MPRVLQTADHKARKQHYCDSCGRKIEVGQTYSRQRCVDGGEAWTYKAHIACIKASQIMWDAGLRGDEDALVNVCDMDREDREAVYKACPEIYAKVWPNAPIPGAPQIVRKDT